MPKIGRRKLLKTLGLTPLLGFNHLPFDVEGVSSARSIDTFKVLDFGARGDGVHNDTEAFQRAIDAAAKKGGGASVVVNGNHEYLLGTIRLKDNITFYLEEGAEILASENKSDYAEDGCIFSAEGIDHLKISGPGVVNGRGTKFMDHYDTENEWWIPKHWRPKLFLLTQCTNLEISEITIDDAPFWTIHLLGCERVRIDGVTIKNNIQIPNCDGIDPDHCRHVSIKNCRISSGDDCIVIKTTKTFKNFGPSAHITISNCVLETQDSGLKIGTETTQDIHDILFEDCRILKSNRGLTIQLRDEGDVYDIRFKNIEVVSQRFSAPWWGKGAPVSFTALPRNEETTLGSVFGITVENVTARGENGVRIYSMPDGNISGVYLKNIKLNLGKWTSYQGGVYDNRPTRVYPELLNQDIAGFFVKGSNAVTLDGCEVEWEGPAPKYFSNALKVTDSPNFKYKDFTGEAAFSHLKSIDIN